MKNKNIFPLEDIKAGYLLRVRNDAENGIFNMLVLPGNYNSVIGVSGELACISATSSKYWPLKLFDENLTVEWDNKYTVIGVYGYTYNSMLIAFSEKCRELLWERKEPPKKKKKNDR